MLYIVHYPVWSAKNIPERMEIYSTLLGLINLKNHDFVCKAVDSIVDDLRDALKSSSFDDVRYLVCQF